MPTSTGVLTCMTCGGLYAVTHDKPVIFSGRRCQCDPEMRPARFHGPAFGPSAVEIAALREQSEIDSRIIGKLQAELLAATEDSALLNKWEKGQWLIGISSKGEWQAMGQTPGLIGRGFVGKSVRDVLRQIRDLT